jgi:hypothetical protein
MEHVGVRAPREEKIPSCGCAATPQPQGPATGPQSAAANSSSAVPLAPAGNASVTKTASKYPSVFHLF